jgi:hypothetical protein
MFGRVSVGLGIGFLLVFLNCSPGTGPEDPVPFTNLEVGQEWQYVVWEKLYTGDRTFTGDTISVSIIDKEGGLVTFYERSANVDSYSPLDTATFKFQIENSYLKQVGVNSSRIFGFLVSHDDMLVLTDINSNLVTIDIDTSLFLIREQTGKGLFVGHSNSVELFSNTYENVIVYYDETPTYVDGCGHLVVFSLEEGIVATIYFGGFSPVEQYGYQLIRP